MSDITTGLVIRGLKNANLKPFSGEVLDQHSRLTEASVNCIEGSSNVNAIMVGMLPNMHTHGIRRASVTDIIKKGGRVMKADFKGNQNHCLLINLTIKDANNLFSR